MTTIQSHRFAWDGVAFDIPADWELATQSLYRGVCEISMEDIEGVRLEMQWTRPRSEPDAETVRKRYHRLSRSLVKHAHRHRDIEDLPEDWSAFEYDMDGGRVLVLGYYIAHGPGSPFVFVRLHLAGSSAASAEDMSRLLTKSFSHCEDGLCDWIFYDVHLQVDRRFRLCGTALQSGRKLLQFQWRLRRLFVWTFSLANMVLRDHDLAVWCADFLNSFKGIRGPRFEATRSGGIVAHRRRYYPLGHAEEIGRLCWRYHVGFKHLPNRNQIVLWVFHYRKTGDITLFEECFRPAPEASTPTSQRKPDA